MKVAFFYFPWSFPNCATISLLFFFEVFPVTNCVMSSWYFCFKFLSSTTLQRCYTISHNFFISNCTSHHVFFPCFHVTSCARPLYHAVFPWSFLSHQLCKGFSSYFHFIFLLLPTAPGYTIMLFQTFSLEVFLVMNCAS